MFQFGRFAHYMWHVFNMPGCPIRKSSDQFLFANTRSLSQLITSFIASESQGIPRVLFITFFYSCAFCAARYAFFALVMMSHSRCKTGRAQTQQSPIVVCSSFLTSSNMSKNFTEAEGRRYKGGGFHCPAPKLRFSFISKKLRSRTVSSFQSVLSI